MGWKHIKVLGGGADAAAQSPNIKCEGLDPHVASAHRAAMYHSECDPTLAACECNYMICTEIPLWTRATEAITVL